MTKICLFFLLAAGAYGQTINGVPNQSITSIGNASLTNNQFNVSGACGITGTGAVALGSVGTVTQSVPITNVTGNYTLLSTDCGALVIVNSATDITLTVPVATGAFGQGFNVFVQNVGAGTATLSSSSTINGGATFPLPSNQGAKVVSDGANWQVALGQTTGLLNLRNKSLEIELPNAASGTAAGSLVKKVDTSGVLQAAKVATTDTNNALGCVQSGAGTTGTAQVAVFGTANCLFDNTPVTDGDFVIVSTTTAGTASDAGVLQPVGVLNLGVASGSHGACGSPPCGPYSVILMTRDVLGAGGTTIQATPAAAQTIQASSDVPGLTIKQPNVTNTADIFGIRDKTNAVIWNIDSTGATTFNKNVILPGVRSGSSSNRDVAGTITLAAGTGSFTFLGTYATAPVCTATDTTATNAVKVTTTTTTLTLTGTSTDVINYICIGKT